jgi:hypothetical protein
VFGSTVLFARPPEAGASVSAPGTDANTRTNTGVLASAPGTLTQPRFARREQLRIARLRSVILPSSLPTVNKAALLTMR